MKNYHKNPRQIKDKQFANLRAWLAELGDLSGIVHDLNTDEVISGNQRMRAIDIARCEIVLTEGPHDPDAQGTVAHGYVLWQGAKYNYRQVRWTAEQCEKANIVANKAGGSWDFDILANEWEKDDLLEWGFELEELGMLPDDDAPEDPGAQIDRAEELREKWGVETGQLWQLGEHRLICGDCTDATVVAQVMGGERAALVVTSPPYLQQRKYTDDSDLSDWDAMICGCFSAASCSTECQVLVNLGMVHESGEWVSYWDAWCKWMSAQGWRRFGLYIWDQGAGLPGDWGGRLGPAFEFVFHFNKVSMQPNKWVDSKMAGQIATKRTFRHDDGRLKPFTQNGVAYGDTKIPDSVIRVNRQIGDTGHPAPYSEDFAGFLVKTYSYSQAVVYEPFSGSGTTLIACERLARRCRAIEISPAYCAVAIERWADMTGGTPELVAVRTADNTDA